MTAPPQIGAGIAAGILLVTQAGLLTAYLLDKDTVADKNRQIVKLQNELGVINAANSSLTALAEDAIPALANQLGLFSAVWTGVSADAAAVATWLSNGRLLLVSAGGRRASATTDRSASASGAARVARDLLRHATDAVYGHG